MSELEEFQEALDEFKAELLKPIIPIAEWIVERLSRLIKRFLK